MKYYKSYKYLIKPSISQITQIIKNFECCTIVYNMYISENGYEKYKDIKAKEILLNYKEINPYLKEADSSALINLLFKLQDKRNVFKTFKYKKEMMNSYTTSNLSGKYGIYFVNNDYINVPKLGSVKTVIHRKIPENSRIISATVTTDIMNNYYICITFEYEFSKKYFEIDMNKSIGLDYSSPYMFVDSNGEINDVKHFYQIQENRIIKLNKVLSKCQKNSNNYYKIKNKINKIYKKITNQRNDYLHKLTRKMVNKYDLIAVEDLDLNVIAKRYNLAKNTYDNCYGKFLNILEYKMNEEGKVLIKVDRYFPSSKICNNCGYINNNLSLKDKEWMCPNCNVVLNRDVNAAINIRKEGIKKFKSIGYLDQAYKTSSIPVRIPEFMPAKNIKEVCINNL